MASVWMQRPGMKHPEKIEGYLEGNKAVARLKKHAVSIARKDRAKLTWLGQLEAKLTYPKGKVGSVYLEAYSPSSKPETGQGRLWDEDGGVLKLTDGTLVAIGKPKGKETA